MSGINRNILECKEPYTIKNMDALYVLIETYWNVKISALLPFPVPSVVLIETYWNVK